VNKTGIILSIFLTGVASALWAENGPAPAPTPGAKGIEKPIPYPQKSSVFKKTHSSAAGPASAQKPGTSFLLTARALENPAPWDYSIPLYSKNSIGSEEGPMIRDPNYYGRLNSNLYSAMGYQPQVASPSEQIIGAVLGVAGKACAGVAAAQALGILSHPGGTSNQSQKLGNGNNK
jgi:hypothetical protein